MHNTTTASESESANIYSELRITNFPAKLKEALEEIADEEFTTVATVVRAMLKGATKNYKLTGKLAA